MSLGLCLPVACSTDHLESIVNNLLRAKSSSLFFEIPKNTCQFEENVSELKAVDLVVMYEYRIPFAFQ